MKSQKLKPCRNIGVFESVIDEGNLKTICSVVESKTDLNNMEDVRTGVYAIFEEFKEYFTSRGFLFVAADEEDTKSDNITLQGKVIGFKFVSPFSVNGFPLITVIRGHEGGYYATVKIDTLTLSQENPIILDYVEKRKDGFLTSFQSLKEITEYLKNIKPHIVNVGKTGIFERIKNFKEYGQH